MLQSLPQETIFFRQPLLYCNHVQPKSSDQKNADLSEECATQVLKKYNIEKDIVAHIKKEFDVCSSCQEHSHPFPFSLFFPPGRLPLSFSLLALLNVIYMTEFR